jgi:hypothetical protein
MAFYELKSCTDSTIYVVDSGEKSLTNGSVYSFSADTGELFCGTASERIEDTSTIYGLVTDYDDCGDCLTDIIPPPISANTDYNVCVECNDKTFTVEVEHPVWTNQYGQTVIQLNAVELGGRNGLYS